MAAAKSDNGTGGGVIQGWHVAAGMVAFFGVIFAVNGYFLASALNTHTGIVSKQPYRKGLDYNRRIAADARQQELGWRHGIALAPDRRSVEMNLADRHGQPVTGLLVEGFIGRPSTEQHDVRFNLREVAPGRYKADIAGLAPGNWLLQVAAQRATSTGTETAYRLRKRLWLKP